MVYQFTIKVTQEEAKALHVLAASEFRNFREEARLLLRQGMLDRGFLKNETIEPIRQVPTTSKRLLSLMDSEK